MQDILLAADLIIFLLLNTIAILFIVMAIKRKVSILLKLSLGLVGCTIAYTGSHALLKNFDRPLFEGMWAFILLAITVSLVIIMIFTFRTMLSLKMGTEYQHVVEDRSATANQLESLVHSAHYSFAILNMDLTIQFISDKWCQDFGLKRPQVTGKSILRNPAGKSELWDEMLERAKDGETIREFVDRVLNDDGTISWFQWEIRPWNVTADKQGGLILFAENLNEKMGLQELIREKSNELERVNHLFIQTSVIAKIGTWEIDLQTKSVYWSDGIYDIHEIEKEQLVRLEDELELYHPIDVIKIRQRMSDAIKKQRGWDEELRIITSKTQNEIWVRSIGTPLIENGKVVRLRGILQNIHTRKEAELQLREINSELENLVKERTKELQKVNENLESFSYSVSHDLRAPLRAINGFSNALKDDHWDQLPEDGRTFIDRIISNTEKMSTLIDDLLTFSKLDRKKLSMEEFDTRTLIESIIENDPYYPKDHIKIHAVPDMVADRSMMELVFINLISNAVKYSSKNKNQKIEIEGDSTTLNTTIVISDNGVGFDMKHANNLFGVFQRLHNSSEFPGTGIGLALCKKIIEAHKGSISIYSEINKGTIVTMTIPKSNIHQKQLIETNLNQTL